MTRIIETGRFASLLEEIPSDFLLIAPPGAAAQRLNAPNQSLHTVAAGILQRSNIGIASPLTSLHLLKKAIRKVLRTRDASSEASRIREILGIVLRTGIDIRSLIMNGSVAARELAEIAERYCELLSHEGLIDDNQALVRAAELDPERRKIFVYGYFRARLSDVKFIDKIAGDSSIYYVPCGDEPIFASARGSVEWLKKNGWEQRPSNLAEEHAGANLAMRFANVDSQTAVDTSAFVYTNIEAEVRGTLAAVKRLVIDGIRPGKIAIVCRFADDYVHTIASVSLEYGLPVRTDSHIVLGESDLGGFVSLIVDMIGEDFEFETTARLLHHRFGPGISAENWTAARLIRATGVEGWTEAGVDLSRLVAEGPQSIHAWATWLKGLLAPIKIRIGATAFEMLAYNHFLDALFEITDLEDSRQIEFDGFAAIIHELLQTLEIRLDPSNCGVALYQPDSIIGGEFDQIFVVGMAEGMLPSTTSEDLVIDFHEQRKLEQKGIVFDGPAEFPRWEALSFYYVLLAARRGITLSYPRVADNEEKIESPYFDRLGIKPVKADIRIVSSKIEERRIFLRWDDADLDDAVFQSAQRQYAIENRRESAGPYDEFDGVTGIPFDHARRSWSVSQLTKIGQCPFKWYAEKILRLSTVEEVDTDLKNNVTGKLYHKTLQIAVEKAMNATPFREVVLAGLEAAFLEAEEDEEISVKQLPNWEQRRAEHLDLLRKAVAAPAFIGESSRVVAVEKDFEAVWEGFRMRGRIDRIDETPEGLAAVDYKLGSYIGKIQDEIGALGIDLQLPVYSRVALPSLFQGRPVASGVYFSINNQKITKENDAELGGFVARTRKMLAAGSFAVEPDIKKKACEYCEFDTVCRQGQRQSRKPKTEWS